MFAWLEGVVALAVAGDVDRQAAVAGDLANRAIEHLRVVGMAQPVAVGCQRDVDDLRPDDHAVVLEHRPEQGTKLKNGENGERWVYLGPRWYQVLDDYSEQNRHDVTDEYGRRPLLTTRYGRPGIQTPYQWVCHITQPCEYGECPHDRDPLECDARENGKRSQCPSAVGPHAVRRGAITSHLAESVSPEVVSERMDVSLEVLYKHYDVRTDREKMQVRKEDIQNQLWRTSDISRDLVIRSLTTPTRRVHPCLIRHFRMF